MISWIAAHEKAVAVVLGIMQGVSLTLIAVYGHKICVLQKRWNNGFHDRLRALEQAVFNLHPECLSMERFEDAEGLTRSEWLHTLYCENCMLIMSEKQQERRNK